MTLSPEIRDGAVALAALSYWGSGDHKSFLASYEHMPLEPPIPTDEMNAILREAEILSDQLTDIVNDHIKANRRAQR
jgi:hypothetical protein